MRPDPDIVDELKLLVSEINKPSIQVQKLGKLLDNIIEQEQELARQEPGLWYVSKQAEVDHSASSNSLRYAIKTQFSEFKAKGFPDLPFTARSLENPYTYVDFTLSEAGWSTDQVVIDDIGIPLNLFKSDGYQIDAISPLRLRRIAQTASNEKLVDWVDILTEFQYNFGYFQESLDSQIMHLMPNRLMTEHEYEEWRETALTLMDMVILVEEPVEGYMTYRGGYDFENGLNLLCCMLDTEKQPRWIETRYHPVYVSQKDSGWLLCETVYNEDGLQYIGFNHSAEMLYLHRRWQERAITELFPLSCLQQPTQEGQEQDKRSQHQPEEPAS